MALSYALDVQQGFTFTPGSHDAVGYLSTATVCGAALKADLTVTNPLTNASMGAAGVLAQVQWAETAGAPLSFTVFVSAPNRGVLEQLVSQQIASTAVILNFGVYQYDVRVQKYFCAFAPEQPPLEAVIAKTGRTLELQVAAVPTQVGKSLQAYEVTLTAGPLPSVQVFKVAPSATDSVAKPWGLMGTV